MMNKAEFPSFEKLQGPCQRTGKLAVNSLTVGILLD